MYSRLKALKARANVDKSTGKVVKIGGRGRITEQKMKLFQRYYGKAIRSNVNDASKMKTAVMAIFYHSLSSDSNPLHFSCPPGKTSWCNYQRAKANNETPPHHNQTIPDEVAPFVKRVFLDLSADELMERCVLGATQNQNESFNSIIWSRCPKVGFCSRDVVETAVNFAVITFNSGMKALLPLFDQLGYHYGPSTSSFLKNKDVARLWTAEYKDKELVKKRRRAMRLDRVIAEEENVEAEGGPSYASGQF